MFSWIKENSIAFTFAVFFHLLLLAVLFFNWPTDKPKKIVLNKGNSVQVRAVNSNDYMAEVNNIKQQKIAEKRYQDKLKRKKIADKKKKKAALKKAQQEKKRQQAEKKAAIQRKKEAIRKKAEKEKRKKEAKRKKAEKEKRKIEQRKKAEKKKAQEVEKKRKIEKKRKAKARAKAKEKREIEEKRKAEKQREADSEHQAELKRQALQDEAIKEIRSKGIIKRHVALIQQKIERNWRQPLGSPKRLECRIKIVLVAGGRVTSVSIIKSSGNLSFDRSVENAVRRASPLPVPTDNVLFKKFEVMRLLFDPGRF